ncbi:MAG: M16 family metallopeptidase, partial [Planctomycetota bacterium]
PDLPAPSGRRIVQVRRKGLSQAQVRFVLAGVGIDHPDWPALELASYVLGTGGFSNRLVQGLREEKGLAYREGAGWLPAYDPNGLFWGFFATRNAGTLEALTVTLEIFTRFLEEGVGEEELQQARERFLNAEVFDYDTPVKSLDRVAGLEFHNLPWNLPEKIRRELEGLNPRKVLAAVQRHFDPDRLLIFVLGNEGIPAEELAALGPVEPWSLEGAGPPQASAVAAAEHREAGAALVRGILTSHGGLEAWKAARALQVAWKAPDGSSGIFHLSLPSPTRTSAPPCRLPTVLMELARGKFQAESPAEGRLFLRKGGEDPLLLTVGRDGLVRSLARTGQRPFEEHYGGYALHGGLYLPATCTASSEAGKREIVLSDWQVNPEGEPPR